MSIICKNCATSFEGNYCGNCGQTANTYDINGSTIFSELLNSILNVNKGFFFTTKELLLRPGHTIREYIVGKRVNHFRPLAYLLWMSTIYYLLTSAFGKQNFISDFIQGINNAAVDRKNESFLGSLSGTFQWLADNYAYTTLLLIPFISLGSYIFFSKQKYNYFQHIILNSYIAGQRTVVYSIILLATSFIKNENVNDVIDLFKVLLGIGLAFWAYLQFFQSNRPIKTLFLTFLTYVFVSIVLISLFIMVGVFYGMTKG